VTETSGNTVKVVMDGSTAVTKSATVTKAKVYPGDSVVVAGTSAKNGTVTATSVTDSGDSSTASTTSSTSTGGTSGAGAAGGGGLAALFGGG
jgi:hypothetical protein